MAQITNKYLANKTIDGGKIADNAIDGYTHIKINSIPIDKIDWPDSHHSDFYSSDQQEARRKFGEFLSTIELPLFGSRNFEASLTKIVREFVVTQLKMVNQSELELETSALDLRVLQLEEKFKTVDEFSELRNRVKGFSLI